MKTIAITIDEGLLAAIDGLLGRAPGPRGRRRSRSDLVREALRRYLADRERREREARESAAIARHRDRLRRQAEALVEDQAAP